MLFLRVWNKKKIFNNHENVTKKRKELLQHYCWLPSIWHYRVAVYVALSFSLYLYLHHEFIVLLLVKLTTSTSDLLQILKILTTRRWYRLCMCMSRGWSVCIDYLVLFVSLGYGCFQIAENRKFVNAIA